MNLSMPDAPEIDWEAEAKRWREIADALHSVARACTCEFERNRDGVPLWFPKEGGGIERRLTKRCSMHLAIDAYEAAVKVGEQA